MANWDKRYAEAEANGAMFGTAANNYVVQTIARGDFEAKTALCLADGDGRNGRFLASQGLTVTAVDISAVATDTATQLDIEAGVEVERITADLADWKPASNRRWDAVFLIYLQCTRAVRQRAVELAVRHLAPGGWFVAEGFAIRGDDSPQMGPPDSDLLYSVSDFDEWLSGFEVMETLTGVVRLQEGVKHQGLAQVVRYAARRSGG
jgi:SAM-dependent methyltransferase